MKKGVFEIKDQFYLNGEPFQIISGSIHYFRVVPEYWRDRLEKLKAMGCNTVETYVAWNLHEAKEGQFDFSGRLDLKHFLQLAQQLGLYVIVRPSPYICAEWEWGGLPAWLMEKDGIRLRVYNQPYLDAVSAYYRTLFEILTPLQINYGGPIILMQVENEYGSYGSDKQYLNDLKAMMKENGVVVPLVTSDGPWGDLMKNGTIDDVFPTGNFGSKTIEQFEVLKHYIKGGPLMCMEFWIGWFDHWGCEKHNTTQIESCVADFEDMLRLGNVNIYMFHGGTNFGFMNGANYYDKLTPDVTSYDYDALLTEDGQMTPKYRAFQQTIAKYREIPKVDFTTQIQRRAYGTVAVRDKVGLFEVLDEISQVTESAYPMSMERLGQNYGYILYRTQIGKGRMLERFKLVKANDRAIVYANQNAVATLMDRELLEEMNLDLSAQAGEITMDILVENLGRVNYGQLLEYQRKGIDGGVFFNGHYQNGFKIYPLAMDNLDKLDFSKGYQQGKPAFYRFFLTIDTPADTFLDMTGWGKGIVLINGFHLGRYWEKGPQKRLYIPAPLLKSGENTILVFETEGKSVDTIALEETPHLG